MLRPDVEGSRGIPTGRYDGRRSVFSSSCGRGIRRRGLGEIIQAEMKRREFRKKVPMSVFIDLDNKR
jgi:hypothetical protein